MSTTGTYPLVRHDAQIAVGLEDDHGVAVTPTRRFGEVTDAGDMPDPEVEWQEDRDISNRGREISGKEPGRNTYDGGSLTVEPVDAFPFEFLFGQEADANGVIEVSNNPLPKTATVEATYFGAGGDADFVRTFVGNAVDSGTINVNNESQLEVDLSFQAQGVTTGTTPTTGIPEPDTDPWLFHDADSYLTLHGTEYARVTDFSWELSNNLDPRYYIQPNDPEDPYEIHYGNAGHAITVDVTPVDGSLFQSLIGRDDAGNASISFTNPAGASLSFDFERVGIESAPYSFPDEGSPDVSVSLLPDRGYITYDDGTPAE